MGRVTGTHYINDLRLAIPYRVPVTISDEDYLQSKDLHRALQQGKVMRLPHGPVVPKEAMQRQPIRVQAPGPDPALLKGLEQQVAELRRELTDLKTKQTEQMSQQTTALDAILGAVNKLGDSRTIVISDGQRPVSTDVVGGEAPAFIPSSIVPEDAEARVEIKVSEGKSIDKAASRLREIRQREKE